VEGIVHSVTEVTQESCHSGRTNAVVSGGDGHRASKASTSLGTADIADDGHRAGVGVTGDDRRR